MKNSRRIVQIKNRGIGPAEVLSAALQCSAHAERRDIQLSNARLFGRQLGLRPECITREISNKS